MSCDAVFDIDITVERETGPISVTISSAERLVALVGPSGIGKTSVLNAIAGLLRPVRGRIAVCGQVLFDAQRGIDRAAEHRGCGYVFQDARLFPHLSVRENLLFGTRYAKDDMAIMGLDECSAFLGISELLHRRPRTLSGGEIRRIAIGRALLRAPRFLLLDEPLASLDPARREGILAVLERIRDELGLPIIHVSHDRAEVSRLSADPVVMGHW